MEILAFSSGWQDSTWNSGTFEKEGIDEENINIPGFHFRSHVNAWLDWSYLPLSSRQKVNYLFKEDDIIHKILPILLNDIHIQCKKE